MGKPLAFLLWSIGGALAKVSIVFAAQVAKRIA